jgi:hypothetical protein
MGWVSLRQSLASGETARPHAGWRWAALLVLAASAAAQAQFAAPGPPPPANAKAGAPQDLTGYWVSLVTEDWRQRMMTPDKGDFSSVPVNSKGRDVANQWNPDKDIASGDQCKAYGAAAIMRVPTRLHITWRDENTLRVETDAGKQVRELHFGAKPSRTPAPSLQGYSVAMWDGLRPGGQRGVTATLGGGGPKPSGYLKVETDALKPGYLRKNGIPYGSATQVEEYFDSFTEANGDTWLVVTSIVTDPEYLSDRFITSSHFKKLAGPTGWRPSDCEAK